MTKPAAAMLTILAFASLYATPPAKAAQNTGATPAQADCGALNRLNGEGKFTGQISNTPDGSTMQVSYGNDTVVVHYTSSLLVCQGGQPASVDAFVRGASVSVFGPMRRTGNTTEINAVRIFVAGPPRTARPSLEPSHPSSQQAPPRATGEQEQPRPTGQQAPLRTMGQGLPNSVILRGGTHPETMQRLHVVRKYALADLRTSPQVTLGEAHLDLRPMLNNPKALFNLAPRLHGIRQHVEVREESSEVSEVDQGLVIHHVLSYRILPGKCADPGARTELVRAGIGCFTRASTSDHIAEFSKPGSPRYVAK